MVWSVALAVTGRIALHGGHPAGSFAAFHWSYLVASVLLVGGVGGLLYWYYGRVRSAPD